MTAPETPTSSATQWLLMPKWCERRGDKSRRGQREWQNIGTVARNDSGWVAGLRWKGSRVLEENNAKPRQPMGPAPPVIGQRMPLWSRCDDGMWWFLWMEVIKKRNGSLVPRRHLFALLFSSQGWKRGRGMGVGGSQTSGQPTTVLDNRRSHSFFNPAVGAYFFLSALPTQILS